MTSQGPTDALADLIWAHLLEHKKIDAYRTADAILASDWLAARVAAERERVLREAADAWTQGEWSDVMLPKPTPPVVLVIAYANRVGDWLRNRAALADPKEKP